MKSKPMYRVTTNGHVFRVEARMTFMFFSWWVPISPKFMYRQEDAIELAKEEQRRLDTRTFTHKNTMQVWP